MKIAVIGGARAAVLEYGGNEHYLLYNGNAMFTLEEEFGADYMDSFSKDAKRLFRMVQVFAEQGELARRHIGLDQKDMLDVEEMRLLCSPMQLASACTEALAVSINREVKDDDEEIDLGLIELQKKSPKAGRNTSKTD